MDPIKFYEYRAAGLPVLSTTFGEMMLRGARDGVYFLDRGGDLKTVVDQALNHPTGRAEMERFRRDHDWQSRFRQADPFRLLLPSLEFARAA